MSNRPEIEKLENVRNILLNMMVGSIKTIELRDIQSELKIILSNGSSLYITYNAVGDHSYQLLFSSDKLDRVRFDSFDKKWEVKSKPNHFHPRFISEGFNSPMNGDFEHDLPLLINLIHSNVLLNSNTRF